MSYFDDASLVMIPSGYKTSKVYSVKPTDGSGDLTFSRSNDTATRVNSAGLIEKVRTNLAQRSDAFDNAYWVKNGSTVTANAIANPIDGALTADKIVENTATQPHGFYNSAITTTALKYTFSVYAKAGERSWIFLNSYNGAQDSGAFFNLSNGTIGTTTGPAKIESVGNGWYRCSVSPANVFTAASNEYWGQVYIATGDNTVSYTGDGTSGIYLFGAQFEVSDFGPTAYIATTSAAVSVGPVANVPRLDYLNSSCPRLLLEPQRQNVITFSEQMDNAAWTKEGITISANATTSPDGYTNADKLVASASAGDKYAAEILTVSNGVAYTTSAYFKAAEYTYAFMRLGGTSGNPYVIYNLATQAVVSTFGLTTSTITSVGNGWYRVTATATQTSTTLAPVLMVIPSTGYTIGGDNIVEFTGNGTSGGFIWGCQSEEGAYATSYIPTLGAAVTRGADACSKTGISSLIGSTAGTVYFEGVYDSANTADVRFVTLKGAGGTYANLFIVQDKGNGTFNLSILDNSLSVQADITWTHGLTNGQSFKIAIAYASNDVVVYQNGSSKGTDTSYTPVTFSDFYLQYVDVLGKTQTSQALLFKTRLSNADLAALTA